MLHLVLVGECVEGLQILQGDNATVVRNIHRSSRIREDAAPLDSHAERVHAEFFARQRGVGVVLDVRARPIFGHPLGQPEQLVDRVVHPSVPVGIRIHRRPGTALGLEARMRDTPMEIVGKRQVDAVDTGHVDRDGLRDRVPTPGIQEISHDGHELQQPERAVDMKTRRLLADNDDERVGAADGGHRVHRPVREVAVIVDGDHAAVERAPDDRVGQLVVVDVGRADIARDEDVTVDDDSGCSAPGRRRWSARS